MPDIKWEEVSELRHDLAAIHNKMVKLDLTIRSLYATANVYSVVNESTRMCDAIKDMLWDTIDELDMITINHESEEL